ncbi:hypothetical protein JCM10908_003807 [Rhodotorula pacifica]|uniref:uncharacterized protein n=1 Tax=Rhodotorula pacifica TaxID=1495444 RepID=UPI00316B14E2
MPPKRSLTTSGGSARSSRPSKRFRHAGIGAPSADDAAAASPRLAQAQALAERAGGGASYLAVRPVRHGVRSLKETSLQVAARGLYESIRITPQTSTSPHKHSGGGSNIGWDPDRDPGRREESQHLRSVIKTLPVDIANRLLRLVLDMTTLTSFDDPADPGVSVMSIAMLFFHPNTTRLSLSGMAAPTLLVSRIPQCTTLAVLDLSGHVALRDPILAKVVAQLPTLEVVNLKGCTKVGDQTMVALSKASEDRLKEINLSLTAVTIKGLTSLLARCKNLEVLKLANVQGLNERNVSKWITDATDAALGWRHVPLSRLRTLKVRSTEFTDASIGRLLSLCAPTLERLDVSYSSLKTLDFISSALHTLAEWKLIKLVASGLPLTPATLQGFFEPLAERTDEERRRFTTLKLGSLPASSTKAPGLTDAVLAKLMPSLEKLDGLEKVSFFQNWSLGKLAQPLSRFIEEIGRKCIYLDLTLPVETHHLEGLLPPVMYEDDEGDSTSYEPPRLQTLVIDSSRITDAAAGAIGACRDLRSLHVAETRISTRFLSTIMASCPHLAQLNLTSCRGVPVTQRRNFFEAWAKGESSEAYQVLVSDQDEVRQVCSGMWGKDAKETPFIEVIFSPASRGQLALVIFEWKDSKYLGISPEGGASENTWSEDRVYICTAAAREADLCQEAELGQFIKSSLAPEQNSIYTASVRFDPVATLGSSNNDLQGYSAGPFRYEVPVTGYYCVGTVPVSSEGSVRNTTFMGVVDFENVFSGQLPASEYPKVSFYRGIFLAYLAFAAFWGALSWTYRRELLPLQRYITATVAFLVVEQFFVWLYYRLLNNGSHPGVAGVYLFVVSALTALRNSVSLYLLCLVSMGLSVVRPTLGSVTGRVKLLAMFHFVFGFLYSLGSVTIPIESSTFFVLFFVLPLSFSLTAFMTWIMYSLHSTITDLSARRQDYKRTMFRRLFWVLVTASSLVMVFFLASSIAFSSRLDPSFPAKSWKWRWLLLDGWLSILYMLVFFAVAFLWRPTGTNRRLALSDELPMSDREDDEAAALFELPDDEAERDEAGELKGETYPLTRRSRDGHQEVVFDVGSDADESDGDDGNSSHRGSGRRERGDDSVYDITTQHDDAKRRDAVTDGEDEEESGDESEREGSETDRLRSGRDAPPEYRS